MWRKNDKLGHPCWPQFLTNCTVFLIFSKKRTSIGNHKANGVKISYVLNNSSSLKRGSGNIKGKRIVWGIFDTTFFYPRRKSLLKVTSDHPREVTGSNPVEALIFFRLLPSNCLNWKNYCDDHSSLSSTIAVQHEFHIYIYFTKFLLPHTAGPLCMVKKLSKWHNSPKMGWAIFNQCWSTFLPMACQWFNRPCKYSGLTVLYLQLGNSLKRLSQKYLYKALPEVQCSPPTLTLTLSPQNQLSLAKSWFSWSKNRTLRIIEAKYYDN